MFSICVFAVCAWLSSSIGVIFSSLSSSFAAVPSFSPKFSIIDFIAFWMFSFLSERFFVLAYSIAFLSFSIGSKLFGFSGFMSYFIFSRRVSPLILSGFSNVSVFEKSSSGYLLFISICFCIVSSGYFVSISEINSSVVFFISVKKFLFWFM